ncbi:DUF2461 domain-containing protein [Subsaximicrobium wynnwilliamsii]|uniref:DUF2461 domain-containing protein n=1 Tax=Subsaximicrobium wynnwilliamsii TaxID=291179 RepID=A0A5C6ZDX8_9FLAO|nr:DUF2461 domain-containing protein [Subsaximicrobium wynnwilliamsii]TXD82147.1 DUF2461 domain-containing protein [Subsaximicrobium wynnwilliamsii]TXD87792.1 DUF2461 domain-containing protein [Subsaximicrobium wynnwilliamsii]TXE01603.1 DUF2461 domain-containing protein [Subsaximicrobium wynnwilliamsii]
MVDKAYIFRFLRDLGNNNSKEWMDDNRAGYHTMKERWLEEIDLILKRLAQYDTHYETVNPKKTISRINNNRRFHPEKPTYKQNLTCSPAGKKEKGKSTFFISIGPDQSFIGGGLYHPSKEHLEKIRAAIDYNGDTLKTILNEKQFKSFYGGLNTYDDKLVTSPQNYDKNHAHIDLINHKSFTATIDLTEAQVTSAHFVDLVEEAFLKYKPLDDYLVKAITMDS